jgi:ectoine hydroxylase-related dioxygenase (phytanoyl-CoA dioxygenase family)
MVLENSLPLFSEFVAAHEHEAPAGGWEWKDSYHYTPSQLQWYYDRGCEWKKVECSPGDLILWDSRCVHYGAAAHGQRPRVATCESTASWHEQTGSRCGKQVLTRQMSATSLRRISLRTCWSSRKSALTTGR